jgi:spermidine synthase
MTGGPYHLILLSVIFAGGYLLTYLLVSNGLIQKGMHRQIWNIILLLSFLISGILGMLLVIQLNYKLEWSFMKPLMVWHVDAGIVLSLVAFLHFLRHRHWFLHMFSNRDKGSHTEQPPGEKPASPHPVNLRALTLGFATTVIQVLMIRELTTVFQGNELMMSWTLGIWMLLTGAGTWLGRKVSPNINSPMLLLIAWVPVAGVILPDVGRSFLFPAGELVNPFWFMAVVLFSLTPVCLLSGYTFAWLMARSGTQERSFVRVYTLESLGSVIGGLVVSFLLVQWFSILQSLLITGLLIHISLLVVREHRGVLLSALLQLLLLILFLMFPLDLYFKSFLFPHQNLIISKETAWGNVSVSENGGEYTFFENGTPLFSTGDVVVNEEYIHYAMMQHPHPADILLISGGVAGMAEEILKYPGVRKVNLVELNPEIIRLSAPFHLLPADPRLVIYEGDGRRFIQKTRNSFDVIIVAVPEPSSLQMNRYYSTEFLSVLKTKMNQDGIVLFGLSASGNYLSTEKTAIESMLFSTLKSYFRHIAIIPGEREFFLASDQPLSEDPSLFMEGMPVKTIYVNAQYLDPGSMVERSRQIRERLDPGAPVNSDRHPLPVFYHSLQFLSIFFGRNYLLMILPLLLLLLPLFLMRPVSGSMYITGLTASSAEILLIFWFQTFFGNVYFALGLIFAFFMAGLSVGSWAARSMKTGKKSHLLAQMLVAVYLLLLPLLWSSGIRMLSGPAAWLVFIPVLLIPALLTGYLFVSASLLYRPGSGHGAPAIYAADLWGSALGVILITFILVPVFGIRNGCLILAGLNLISVVFLGLRKK